MTQPDRPGTRARTPLVLGWPHFAVGVAILAVSMLAALSLWPALEPEAFDPPVVGDLPEDCSLPEDMPSPFSHPLRPGGYALRLVALEGSRAGSRVDGVLYLEQASRADRSPVTGEVAETPPTATPFYGWMKIDLSAVAAPVCRDDLHPQASSRDPVFPGVLVLNDDFAPDARSARPPSMPLITVASLTNRRLDEGWVDGCGFAMHLQTWNGRCFRGRWSEWGVRKDGRGVFCLCE